MLLIKITNKNDLHYVKKKNSYRSILNNIGFFPPLAGLSDWLRNLVARHQFLLDPVQIVLFISGYQITTKT